MKPRTTRRSLVAAIMTAVLSITLACTPAEIASFHEQFPDVRVPQVIVEAVAATATAESIPRPTSTPRPTPVPSPAIAEALPATGGVLGPARPSVPLKAVSASQPHSGPSRGCRHTHPSLPDHRG